MADTATLEGTEQSLDQQLDALFKDPGATAPGAPGGDTKADTGAKPDQKASSDPAAPDPFEKALEDIKEEEPPKEEVAPKLSDDQSAVIKAIPTAEMASNLFEIANNYQNFTSAFESGNFKAVDKMLQDWNPDAYETFLENIYQKHMVSGDWAERFIAEAEGRGQDRKGQKSLEAKISKLEARIAAKESGSAAERQHAANMTIANNYENYVNGLFDQLNFNKGDRKYVFAELNQRVGADPSIMQAVRGGRMSAINGIFKAVAREYVNRDKEVSTEKDVKIAIQDKKKAPIGGSGNLESGQLPDDVKQVPKGQEDTWMMQQLGKLANKVGLKR
jgi:hypothetical protein